MLHWNLLVRNHVLVALLEIKKSFIQWLVKIFHMHRQLLFWKDLECPFESSDIWDQLCAAELWLLVPDMSVFTLLSYNNGRPLITSCLWQVIFCIHMLHTLPSANSVYERVLTIQFPFKNYVSWVISQLLRKKNSKKRNVASVLPTSGVANALSQHSYWY